LDFWRRLPPDLLVSAALALVLAAWTFHFYSLVSVALVAASLVLAATSFWSCSALFGKRCAWIFLVIAALLGWFAEEMGSTRGWFFGSYAYTDVLGPRIGSVPVVIPLMWFGLCHVCFVLASLLLWRRPAPATSGWKSIALASLMTAMVITAFDLGADPYFVYVLKAWIMAEKDGDWFGETVRGFEGWMLVSFVIVTLFQAIAKPKLASPLPANARNAALVPIGVYAALIVFQMCFTAPVALRVVAFFAMGIPALVAAVAWSQWIAQMRAEAA